MATHIALSSAKGAAVVGTATTNTAPTGWQNYFDYTAVAAIGSAATNTLNTGTVPTFSGSESTATASGTASAGPVAGDLTVAITPNGFSPNKLIAGTYTDTLTVTLTAN